MYFHYFVIISPRKRAGPFIWTNLNPLHPRMLCAKFGWNWPCGSGEQDENVKSLQRQQRQRRRRRTMDKFWSEKLTWAFGSGELKTCQNLRFCAAKLYAHTLYHNRSQFLYIWPLKIWSNIRVLESKADTSIVTKIWPIGVLVFCLTRVGS